MTTCLQFVSDRPPLNNMPNTRNLIRRTSSMSDMARAQIRAASLRLDIAQTSTTTSPVRHSEETKESIRDLGQAIEQLGRTPSLSSINTDSTEARTMIPVTSSNREKLIMKQVAANIIALRKGPVQCFRVKDEQKRRRFVLIYPGDTTSPTAPEFLVVDEGNGRPVWSVRPGPTSGAKVLVKPNSDYHILLMRKQWVKNMKKLVEGNVFRDGRTERQFVVKGDALGRRFSVHRGKDLIAQMHRGTQVAQPGRNIVWSFANVAATSANQTIARWEISVEPDVDTALMSAIMSVLERWMVEGRERRR